MAKPVAYFGYTKNGLQVTFINNSLNSPQTYQWDFGDGGTSTVKDPVHTYSNAGFYTVSLISSNGDGDSDPLIITVGVSATNNTSLNASIFELIDQYMPSALVGETNATEKVSLIMRWQLYLQPLVEVPNEVSVDDTHNEFAWPGLVNFMIAQLCAYDIVLQGANQFLSASGNLGGSSSTTTTTDEDAGDQKIKSIKTGPAETEFYEGNSGQSSSEIISNIGEAYSSAVKAGGALDMLLASICQLSKRLRIYLPLCGQLEHSAIAPQVHCPPSPESHNANPFGVTQRMV